MEGPEGNSGEHSSSLDSPRSGFAQWFRALRLGRQRHPEGETIRPLPGIAQTGGGAASRLGAWPLLRATRGHPLGFPLRASLRSAGPAAGPFTIALKQADARVLLQCAARPVRLSTPGASPVGPQGCPFTRQPDRSCSSEGACPRSPFYC